MVKISDPLSLLVLGSLVVAGPAFAQQVPAGDTPEGEDEQPSPPGEPPTAPAEPPTAPAEPPTAPAEPSEAPAPAASPTPARDEPTAADVATAPLPGQETGRVQGGEEEDSLLRDIGQGVLLVPRIAVEITMAPVRGSLWVTDRYQLVERWRRTFFDDTMTYGVTPWLVIDSSYGITGGGRFVHRDLFGEREHFALRAGYGGSYHSVVTGKLRSGGRFGPHVELALQGDFERLPRERFFGLGNMQLPEARFREQVSRAAGWFDYRVFRALHARISGALVDLEYSDSTTQPTISEIYDTSMITGFMDGARNVYGELELRWDSRGLQVDHDTHFTYDAGWYASAYGGAVHDLEGAGGDYLRYGGQVQSFWRLGPGPRAVSTRLYLDAVTGSFDEVAFTQLPRLGGPYLLRGYDRDRFRDRIAALGSLEYTWDLGRYPMASVFVDAGRVYHAWDDLTFDDMRVGFGLSIQLTVSRSFLGAVTFSSSVDGGFFANLTFDPVFDIEPRVEQK